ncbi:Putative secreted lipase [Frankia alni ACN14a]|uniref:Secreted lipase n=1 Tax=Frankia alni (strain DSM 45986 / CECT 9034 / ACN14a) TaxID=326424 RepID=Q0RRK3_FRAAA|nr:Putative secreted lipase [Frankia alni ACN14a]
MRAPAAAGTPILLVHGLVDNRSIFTRLHHQLRRRGFRRVRAVELPLWTTTVEDGARVLAAAVTAAAGDGGHVHVVAHSLGGLVARYHVQRLGGDRQVDTLITLATPHGGTRLAELVPRALPYPLLAQLRPGSPLLVELGRPAPGCRTRFVAVAAGRDTVVRPAQAAIDHPDLDAVNVTVPGLGHHSLAFNGAVTRRVAGWLAGTTAPEQSELLDQGSELPDQGSELRARDSELLDRGVAQQQALGPGVRTEVDRRLGRIPHPTGGDDDSEAEAVVGHPVALAQLQHGPRRGTAAAGER